MIRNLKHLDFKGKRTLVRCDFNVPIKNRKVLDNFKIEQALETIEYLRKEGAKIILMSHLGRPRKKTRQLSLKPVALELEKLLKAKVKFSKKCFGKRVERMTQNLKTGEVMMLENLRFEKGELDNDESFVKKLASLGDVYVNEAFSSCHRSHASVVGLPKLMPHCIGLSFYKEAKYLMKLRQNPEHPLTVIIGGAKVNSKAKVIDNFLEKADHVLLGGKVANTVLTVKGVALGRPFPESKTLKEIKKIKLTDSKMHLPFDVVAVAGEIKRTAGPASVRKEEEIFDIGPETAKAFADIIKESKTIFWSGVLGKVEQEEFSKGTQKVVKAIIRNKDALKVAGGGDTIAFIRKYDLEDKFSYLSMGGTASLEFLANEKMPGIESLR